MNQAIAITVDSFKISGRVIIIELQHSENGLTKSIRLFSEKSGLTWEVIARVLFDHAVHEQKIFEVESTEYLLNKFESLEKRKKSIDDIKDRESNSIFQYLLRPIGHDEKPEQGEKLKINYL